MSTEKTGGPAFPALPITREINGEMLYQAEGITIRDYFAAKAMQGYCSNQEHIRNCTIQMTAESAYEVADAMLEARK